MAGFISAFVMINFMWVTESQNISVLTSIMSNCIAEHDCQVDLNVILTLTKSQQNKTQPKKVSF